METLRHQIPGEYSNTPWNSHLRSISDINPDKMIIAPVDAPLDILDFMLTNCKIRKVELYTLDAIYHGNIGISWPY